MLNSSGWGYLLVPDSYVYLPWFWILFQTLSIGIAGPSFKRSALKINGRETVMWDLISLVPTGNQKIVSPTAELMWWSHSDTYVEAAEDSQLMVVSKCLSFHSLRERKKQQQFILTTSPLNVHPPKTSLYVPLSLSISIYLKFIYLSPNCGWSPFPILPLSFQQSML